MIVTGAGEIAEQRLVDTNLESPLEACTSRREQPGLDKLRARCGESLFDHCMHVIECHGVLCDGLLRVKVCA